MNIDLKSGRIYVRYDDTGGGAYDFKVGSEEAPPVRIPEAMLQTMRQAMVASAAGDAEQLKVIELFDLLVGQARRDPRGRYVSASAEPIAEGQVTAGGDGGKKG